jgi:hypothetical protein
MLKLNVGTNRKVGLPDYGSAGASCNLEVELDTSLFQDLDGLQQVIRRAYAACNQAVQDELARHKAPVTPEAKTEIIEIRTAPTVKGVRVTTAAGSGSETIRPASLANVRSATVSQVRAIRAIASRRRIDLPGLLHERFGLGNVSELGIREASELIDELKSDEADGSGNGHTNGNGAGTYAVTGGAR